MVYTVSIKKNSDFASVYRRGRRYSGKYLVLCVLKNLSDAALDVNAIGVAVSKKVGKSVVRNKIKRVVKENYCLYECKIKRGFYIVFTAKNECSACTRESIFWGINSDMKSLFNRAGLLIGDKWENSQNGA